MMSNADDPTNPPPSDPASQQPEPHPAGAEESSAELSSAELSSGERPAGERPAGEPAAAAESAEVPQLTLGGTPVESPGDPDAEGLDEAPKVFRDPVLTASGEALGTGRRKTSVARVRIKAGTGQIFVNKKPLEEYFPVEKHQTEVLGPLKTANAVGSLDIKIIARGGGISGQAGAARMGLGRALVNYNPQIEESLREAGHLTRDSRMVERKKPGRKKARKSFQFSKR